MFGAPHRAAGRHRVLVAIGALLVVIVGAMFLRGDRQRGEAARSGGSMTGAGGSVVNIDRSRSMMAVHVAGSVRRPGVYRLRGGKRVGDAVERAGGPAAEADIDAVNLAAKLNDGQQVVVPARVGPSGSGSGAGERTISLNSATVEELQELDGVGPVTAQKIVEFRTKRGGFGAIEELEEIPGIGPKRLEAMRAGLGL